MFFKIRFRAKFYIAFTVLAAIVLGLVWVRMGSLPVGLLQETAKPSTVVVDRNGIVLYEALSSEETRAIKLSSEALPPNLVAATIAAEDRRFWNHLGIDPMAILRAGVI